MRRTPAEICRANGWGPGTLLQSSLDDAQIVRVQIINVGPVRVTVLVEKAWILSGLQDYWSITDGDEIQVQGPPQCT